MRCRSGRGSRHATDRASRTGQRTARTTDFSSRLRLPGRHGRSSAVPESEQPTAGRSRDRRRTAGSAPGIPRGSGKGEYVVLTDELTRCRSDVCKRLVLWRRQSRSRQQCGPTGQPVGRRSVSDRPRLHAGCRRGSGAWSVVRSSDDRTLRPPLRVAARCERVVRARVYNMPGRARNGTDIGQRHIRIRPAHRRSSQVTTPLTKSARRNFQADDAGSILVVLSNRHSWSERNCLAIGLRRIA